MVKKPKPVLWDIEASSFLKKAISYIKKDSELNAEKVKQAILRSTSALSRHPEKHAHDPVPLK
jgi:plasmid stabilization system protein ParE